MSSSPAGTPTHRPTHLAAREVTLFGDFVAGITNVAPSTAVALTLGAIMAVSGLAAPSVVVLVGLAMLCIAVSYHFMNLWRPSAAAQAMWIARAVRPVAGLAVGFAVILMTLTANVSNITLFGPYLLGIIWPSQQDNAVLQWVCTAVITGLVLFIAIQGVRRAIRFQTIVVWIEYAIIVVFVIALFVAEFTGHPGTTHPQLSWLLPSTAPSFTALMDGAVLGVFMFGGWEASVYLAEEGTDVRRNPGRAGIISVVFCIIWFVLLTMAIQASAPAQVLVAHAGNIIAYSASVIWPKPWSSIVSLAVLSSVVAVVQSQLQNFSRMSFGLSREGLLPKWLGRLSRHRTPALGLTVAAVIPVAALIISGNDDRARQRDCRLPVHRHLRRRCDRLHLVLPAYAHEELAAVHPCRPAAVHRGSGARVWRDHSLPDHGAWNALPVHRDVRPDLPGRMAGQVLHPGAILQRAGHRRGRAQHSRAGRGRAATGSG
jgi:amino acid transporter